jgi:transposase
MTSAAAVVIGGVDTHKYTHYAAVIDGHGRLLGHREFRASERGYAVLLAWIRSHGQVRAIGVESTGNFGAALTRFLAAAGEQVAEVNTPNRAARHRDGKSDRLDAEQIARSVLAETGVATPKSKSGPVEVIRTLRVARGNAVRARTQAFNNLFGTMISAPSPVRDELIELTKRTFVNRCLALEPETGNLLELINDPELFGVSAELAGQFLVTAGDNPERIRNEAAFAKLCGVSPKPASSGRTNGRHRLNRGGDRAANSALYIVTIVRLRHHQPTRQYLARRIAEGLTKREIIRCLKRYIAREVFAGSRPAEWCNSLRVSLGDGGCAGLHYDVIAAGMATT